MVTSFGFWAGLRDEEVCARIAGHTEVMDWVNGQGEASHRCTAMIQRSFGAFEVTVHVLLYIGLIITLVSSVLAWYRQRQMAALVKSFVHVVHDAHAVVPSVSTAVAHSAHAANIVEDTLPVCSVAGAGHSAVLHARGQQQATRDLLAAAIAAAAVMLSKDIHVEKDGKYSGGRVEGSGSDGHACGALGELER
jgi:hypothetical protein